jgi:hypothetical protein
MFAEKALAGQPGRKLILVGYSPDHIDRSDECIFNHANLGDSDIVWAHDMGEERNRELIIYYRGSRNVWLYRPDSHPSTLVPYEELGQ